MKLARKNNLNEMLAFFSVKKQQKDNNKQTKKKKSIKRN